MSSPAPRFDSRKSAFAFTTQRPVAILMVVLAISVFGYVSYRRLALTLMPDMSYPTLTVRTEYPGSAPEEVENTISRQLEQELGIVPRLSSISSISKAGQSDVILEFQWDTDMNTISSDIREKVDRVRLPDGAERPLLLRYDPSLDPILRFALAGPQSLYDLRYLAENEIKRQLEALPGVAAIKVKGGLEEQFLVALDEGRLATLNLDINRVSQRLQQGNVNVPGGNLREGQTQYLIRTMNEFRTMEEISELIVARQNGVDIRVRDIGEVTRYHKDREVITAINGSESIEIEVYKEADANVVEVARIVREAIYGSPEQQAYIATLPPGQKEMLKKVPATAPKASGGQALRELRQAEAQQLIEHLRLTNFINFQLPPEAHLELLADQSVFISNSIEEVKSNAIFGAIIAIAVLFVFLRNVGQTLIIGVCIPISIVATFAPMFMSGVSLNIISLGGLALGVGMLVDNAIVVLESIFRCKEEGDDLQTAVVRGTSEVGMAVTASTLTTIAVFFPIVFVDGVAGQVFGDMALTVVFSLLASLFAALFFIPMLASRDFSGAAGLISGRDQDSTFLQFPDTDRIKGIGDWLRVLGATALKTITSLARAILIFVTVVVKIIVALVGGTFVPAIARFVAKDACGPITGDLVWPGLLIVAGPATFHRSLTLWVNGFRGASILRKITRAILAPITWVLLVLRLIMSLVFGLIGKSCQLLAMTLAVVVMGLIRLGGLLLAPVILPVVNVINGGFAAMQDSYAPLLRRSLANRWAILGSAVSLLVVCWFLLLPRLGSELIPQVHQGEFNLDLTLPVGTPLERTAEIAERISTYVQAQPEVALTAVTAGAEDNATRSSEAGEHTARTTVRLKPGKSYEEENALIERVRGQFADLPEATLEVTYPALFTFKNPIEIEIRGHNLDTLKSLAQTAESVLADVPGLVDVRSSLQSGNPEIRIIYNRERLAEYGLNLRTVADIVRTKVQGDIATEFREAERQIDVVVRLRENDRYGIEELGRVVVNPGSRVPIPLAAIAELQVNEGPSEIRRIDQQRTALISANIVGQDLATVSRDIVVMMETIDMPSGFTYLVTGQNEEMQRSMNSLILAFGLALFLVYIVMASQFESLVQPFLIMMSVPLGLIGVIIALFVTGTSISIMVFIGLIILAGIVVNNAIVLIDYINTLRDRGVEKADAIVQAGQARLRPILMTTLTTVLGLLPMALGLGEGAEIRAPMAITVIAGLSVSMVLTLVVIPTLYFVFGGSRTVTVHPDDVEDTDAIPATS